MQRYIDYVQKLKFNSTPDYKHLLSLFQKIAVSNNFTLDRKFDWLENGTSSTKSSDNNQYKDSINDFTDKM